MAELEPAVMGRFNFISFRKGFYNVLFVPYQSGVNITIAKNLTFEEMDLLKNKLNKILEEVREQFYEDDGDTGSSDVVATEDDR